MELCPYCNSNMPMGTATCRVCGMSLTDLDIALKGGTSLGGRYSIGRVLGQGGFGITYLGADKLLTRPVAIKELVPDGSTRKGTQLVPPSSLRPT